MNVFTLELMDAIVVEQENLEVVLHEMMQVGIYLAHEDLTKLTEAKAGEEFRFGNGIATVVVDTPYQA